MNTIVKAICTAALAAIMLCGAASADRVGDGPVRAPHVISAYHVTFTLSGDSWAQVVDVLSGDPVQGAYAFEDGAVAPTTSEDHLGVFASAIAQSSHPVVRGGRLVLNPASSAPRHVAVRRHGVDGPVRWWTWSSAGVAQAVGYQAAPPGLRGHGRWLVYRAGATVGRRVPDKPAAKRAAVAKVEAIARTMRLARGPLTASPPYAGS
jgi:hypothetical protein